MAAFNGSTADFAAEQTGDANDKEGSRSPGNRSEIPFEDGRRNERCEPKVYDKH